MGQSRTFWDVTVTAGIPFSRWGAEPFIAAPVPFPEKVLQAARSVQSRNERENRPLHSFELALNWLKELAADQTLTKARIAGREGLSRARVTQIMNLLELPEQIQSELRRPPGHLNIQAFSERRLRMILSFPATELQLEAWTEWLRELQNEA